MRTATLAALVAGVIVAALACAPAAPPPAPPAAAPQAPQPAPAPAQAPSFLDIVGAGKQATYKVVYKISGTGGGAAMSGEQTIYSKPPKTRVDMNLGAAASTGSASIYNLEDGTYMCTAQAAMKNCFKMARDQAMQQSQGAQSQDEVQSNPGQYETTYQGPRQIAGQQAQCYGVKPKPGGSADFTEGTFCYASQGVPLLTQVKSQGTDMTMEATSYSSTVADADFQLPAQPMEMPQIPGGMPPIPGGMPQIPRTP